MQHSEHGASKTMPNAMDWLTAVIVPIILGGLSAFGATTYTNHLARMREQQAEDRVAAASIRAYANALMNYSDYLEERALFGGYLDPTQQVMDAGGVDDIRSAWRNAQPYFHRLWIRDGEREAISNSMPDHGDDPMDGAGNFAARAKQVVSILDRGLQVSAVTRDARRLSRSRRSR